MQLPILQPVPTLRKIELKPDVRAEAERIVSRYPVRKAAMLPMLHLMEREFGIVDESAMAYIGEFLGVSPVKVLSNYTFYTWFKRAGTGKYLLQVCCTLPCALRGSDLVVRHLEKRLGLKVGESTKDGKFTLRKVECLASCDTAPVLQINDDLHEHLTIARLDQILDGLK
ncbi:MAG: NAD(P)H-dependent oxidoreductase subunit E [Microthrixaceae bacterium]|nr:NAD(P)H-dependent oxidoreductase subunit E [Microthrixaceae bacterium]